MVITFCHKTKKEEKFPSNFEIFMFFNIVCPKALIDHRYSSKLLFIVLEQTGNSKRVFQSFIFPFPLKSYKCSTLFGTTSESKDIFRQ